jgi:glycerol-3-phosphate acyltransferase PlsY
MLLASLLIVAIAYLLGSIPVGYLLVKLFRHEDIRSVGSGNIGATNVLRTGQRWLAAATLILDAGKGATAVQIVLLLYGPIWTPLAAICAVVGHCYTPWLGFKGGKGVATGLGALLALDWRIGLIACAAWLVVAAATRLSSAAALTAFALSPIAAAFLSPRFWWVAPAAIAALVFWRHRANIWRLVKGTEPRIGKK